MEQGSVNMTVEEYKRYHESFMENNHGSTAIHTFLCIFFTVQCSVFCALSTKYSVTYQYIYEYLVLILPLILAHTILADYIYLLNCIIFAMLVKQVYESSSKLEIRKAYSEDNRFIDRKLHSISCMRGLTYFITVFCILAVDFKQFPRNLAKTESYGYSLMDTGVGLFVLMSGLVHKDLKTNNLKTILKSNTKFISILICLGVARFVSIKQLDYQEHVTEYGVHWNFFFTLAICKVISIVMLAYVQNALLLSIIILLLHEYLLYIDIEKWVFSDTPRTNLINANREGIASTLGYVVLYLFAVYLKSMLTDTSSRYKIQMKLVMFSASFWTLAFTINLYRPASRTLANAGYCLFLTSVLLTVMTVLYFFEVLFQGKNSKFTVPLILSAINDNGISYFLVANLCTGAINLSMKTLFVTATEMFVILNIHMIVNVMLVVYLKQRGLRI